MPGNEIELKPVTRITTDALGPPGKRVFYVQGQKGQETVTLLVEKFQVQSLSIGIEQFLADIHGKFPDIEEAATDYQEIHMHITPPVDPLFRVGELSLGYNANEDLILLLAKEQPSSEEEIEEEGEEGDIVRFWCTRSQIRALAHWGIEIASRGREICPQCGEPMDPSGHFCPKKNGGHAR